MLNRLSVMYHQQGKCGWEEWLVMSSARASEQAEELAASPAFLTLPAAWRHKSLLSHA